MVIEIAPATVETMREKIIMLELEEPSSSSSEHPKVTPQQQAQQPPSPDDSTEPADVSLDDDYDDHPDGQVLSQHHQDEPMAEEPKAEGEEDVNPLQTIVEVVNPAVSGGDGRINDIIIGRYNDDCTEDSFASASSPSTYGAHYTYEEGRYESINDKMKNVLRELKQNEKVRLNLSKSMTEEELAEQEDQDEEDDEREYQALQQQYYLQVQQEQVEGEDEEEGHPDDDEDEEFRHYEEKTGAIGTVFMVRERLINDFYTHQSELAAQEAHHQQPSRMDYYDGCEVIQNPAAQAFEEELEKMQSLTKLQKMTLHDEKLKAVFCADDDEDDDDEDGGTATTMTTTTTTSDSCEVSGGAVERKSSQEKAMSGIPIAGTNGSGGLKRKKRKSKKKK